MAGGGDAASTAAGGYSPAFMASGTSGSATAIFSIEIRGNLT